MRRSAHTLHDQVASVLLTKSQLRTIDDLSRRAGCARSVVLREIVVGFIERMPVEATARHLEERPLKD